MHGILVMTLAGLVTMAAAHSTGQSSTDNCVDVTVGDRRRCGYGIKLEECESRNCCFDENAPLKDACFHPLNPCELDDVCTEDSTCVNGDVDGNGQYECDCPAGVALDTNCRTRQGSCDIRPANRKACGIVHDQPVPQQACEARGCCYNNETYGVKWCFHPESGDRCDDCEYSTGGIGYLPGSYCFEFLQCRRESNGKITEVLMCCPEETYFNPESKTCDWAPNCNDSKREEWCPIYPGHGNTSCYLRPHETEPALYYQLPMDALKSCPAGTVYKHEICGCEHGGDTTCYMDPLLFFPFAYHFNDVQCPKAAGIPHGDAHLVDGYVALDGDGDFVTIDYLNNWFVDNNPDEFTIAIWFNQSNDGFNNYDVEGVIGNGNCNQKPTTSLMLMDEGGVNGLAAGDPAVQLNVGSYNANEWNYLALRYSKSLATVDLVLNAGVIDSKSINGDLLGTMTATTIGLSYIDCIPYFFTGCIDDLAVYVRYVTIATLAANNNAGRTGAGDESHP